MGEFGLIERLESAVTTAGPGLAIGLGDDAAVLDIPDGMQLVVSTDTLNEGIHFWPGTDARSLGHKALAVSLSDLAAMGAEPRWAFLNLSLPEADDAWIDDFAAGFRALADATGVVLAGGDTTRGPLSLTLTLAGLVPAGSALTRAGARKGDRIAVTGHLGDAALALRTRSAGASTPSSALDRLLYPRPRTTLGPLLRDLASACIDISDGLAADLGHIVDASGVAAEVTLPSLPASDALMAVPEGERWALQAGGGDDYELCFTFGPSNDDALSELVRRTGVEVTVIGEITAGEGIRWLGHDGPVSPPPAGFEHFTGGG